MSRTTVRAPALLFLAAGVLHFVMPVFFDRIVPPWVPNARVAAAWGLIALLVAVLPANIHMLNQARAAGESAWFIIGLWARLPVQPLLMWWVWRVAIRRLP